MVIRSVKEEMQPFVDAFHRALAVEMEAMRKRLGPFEVPLLHGQVVDENEDTGMNFYTFKMTASNDKLILNSECTLRYDSKEDVVTVTDIKKETITLSCPRNIRMEGDAYVLVIYPWFLYENLKSALTGLLKSDDVHPESALRTFGKRPVTRSETPLLLPHSELNNSQKAAVVLCSESDLAFVWGPPGTGKTTTLGHIVTELLHKDYRILVTSTTNAAVDQALAKLKMLETAQGFFERGLVVRVGQTGENTHGAGLIEVLHQLNGNTRDSLNALKQKLPQVIKHIRHCDLLIQKLEAAGQESQLALFESVRTTAVNQFDLLPIFSRRRVDRMLTRSVREQKKAVAHRRKRLEKLKALCDGKMIHLSRMMRHKEKDVVDNARLILATMANVYISPLLSDQKFDVVILEEAGMAVLPTLFYCACMAKEKVIIVGDPKQLPPIVQSRDAYVYQAMGRNIFDVRQSDFHFADIVVMLNLQYRMHPDIGDLVSRLYYDRKLKNDASVFLREQIAGRSPFPGKALILVDTEGQTHCITKQGSFSRMNMKTAAYCKTMAQTAVENGIQSVAIITPYAEQSRLIERLLIQSGVDTARVLSRTVHRFQGNERDMVILDTVDTAPFKPGVLLSDTSGHSSANNLINVGLSRARGKLVIISDVAYFKANAPESPIARVLDEAMKTGVCVPWGGNRMVG